MKKVLILGAIEAFCDLISDIKELGIQTIVCDYYPDAPGKKLADFAYDLSTTDVDAMTDIASKYDVDGVICAFSDRNIPTCYEVAQKLRLPTFYTKEIIDIITDKIKMKQHFKDNGFPILNYKIIQKDFSDSDLNHFIFPVIIKPVDSSGSKGVYVCENVSQVRENFKKSACQSVHHTNEIIVEEYYPVDEISVTAWVKEGKAYVTCIYDVGRNFEEEVVLSSIVFPSKYAGKSNFSKITELVQDLTDSLQIKEGPVTVQCFIGERGLKVSEYIYRLAGGSPYKYSQYLGGPNLAKMLAEFSVGDNVHYGNLEEFSPLGKSTVYEYHIYAVKPGKIYFSFDEETLKNAIPECTYVKIYSESGTTFTSLPTGGKVIAVVYCQTDHPDKTSYNSFIEKLAKIAVIEDENGNNITSFHKPQHEVTRICHNLKL